MYKHTRGFVCQVTKDIVLINGCLSVGDWCWRIYSHMEIASGDIFEKNHGTAWPKVEDYKLVPSIAKPSSVVPVAHVLPAHMDSAFGGKLKEDCIKPNELTNIPKVKYLAHFYSELHSVNYLFALQWN